MLCTFQRFYNSDPKVCSSVKHLILWSVINRPQSDQITITPNKKEVHRLPPRQSQGEMDWPGANHRGRWIGQEPITEEMDGIEEEIIPMI